MKKILFIGRRETRHGYETPELMQEYMPSRLEDWEVHVTYFESIEVFASINDVHIYDRKSTLDLSSFDRVFMFGWFKKHKDLALAVAYYLKHHNVVFWNSEALQQRSSGKISQAVIAGLNEITIPKTAFCLEPSDQFLTAAAEYVGGFPIIAKQFNGNKGQNNHLVRDYSQLSKLITISSENPLLLQQFIENTGDMRVIVVGQTVELVLHRMATDKATHLHNISQGAHGAFIEPVSLPEDVHVMCSKLTKLFNRELSGLDIVKSNSGDYYFLETNNMPQLLSWEYADAHADILAKMIKSS